MASPSESTLAAFQRSMIDDNFGELAEKYGLKFDVAVTLFIKRDKKATGRGTPAFGGRAHNAAGTLQYQGHNLSITDVEGLTS